MATFRPERTLTASAYTLGLPIQPLPTHVPAQTVRPPSRIGAPMAGQVPVGRLKTSTALGEDDRQIANIDYDSRLAFSLFDSPDAFFFDNLQFLNRLRVGWETGPGSSIQFDALDRRDLAREILSRHPSRLLPEIHRLLWQWNANGGNTALTFGRQRLVQSGNRTIGSVSWLPDLQVFDGVRLDLGRESEAGKFTLGAFAGQAFVSPSYGGPGIGEDPFLVGAWAWTGKSVGTCRVHARWTPDDPEGRAWLGASWESPAPPQPHRARHRIDALVLAGAEGDSFPWHVSAHRQQDNWIWHAGAEGLTDDEAGRRVSATPGTFRYLPDDRSAPGDDRINLFLGLDHRFDHGALASVTFQHLMEEDKTHAEIIEAAVRHPISPAAAFLAGAGCGRQSDGDEIFLRTGVQFFAAF